MRWAKAIANGLASLFVDDESYALAILCWLAAAWLLLPRLGLPPALAPAILFAGLVLILVESAARRSRQGPSR
jgi:hypothetical protein